MGDINKQSGSSLYSQLFKITISICLCLAVGAIGGLFSENPSPIWYPPMTTPLWILPIWVTSLIWDKSFNLDLKPADIV